MALTRRRLSLIARLLSLALLVGQFGAVAHANSHLSDDPDGLPDTSQVCRACLSFAPLQSAVGSAPSVFHAASCTAEPYVQADETLVPRSFPRPAFQSRAPPALL